MDNEKLHETVEHQPVSLRFKATVLGLVSLARVKDEAESELYNTPEDQ